MLVSPVDEPLINLIAEAERVVLDAEICDHLQLVSGEDLRSEDGNECNTTSAPPPYVTQRLERRLRPYTHLSNRVVGGVDDYGLCLRVEFTGELIWVQNPVGAGVGTFSRLLKVLRGFLISSGFTVISTAFVLNLLCVVVLTLAWPPPCVPSAHSNQRKVL